MPSRETLLSRLVGSMKSPISGLARFFDAAAKDLESQGKETVGQLEGEKKEDVITSYSIHYTKLYESAISGSRPFQVKGFSLFMQAGSRKRAAV